MAPRKSLPAGPTSTPRRAAAIVADSALDASSSRGARRGTKRKHGEGEDEVPPLEEKPLGPDAEKELEAWQDFAAEHYEMVEQLPLELHRNFRLLKELDVGCIGQMDKLHALIREYVNQRIALVKPLDKVVEESMDVDSLPTKTTETSTETNEIAAVGTELVDEQNDAGTIRAEKEEDTERTLEPAAPDDRDHSEVEDNLIPIADGDGGLLAVPESAVDEPAPPRHAFPPVSEGATAEDSDAAPLDKPAAEADADAPAEEEAQGTKDQSVAAAPTSQETGVLPWTLLPDIGKLAREIVRNAEEKVAVAVGAYNAIDRHIRALDSALSAQEASILLGLRPSTLPSSALDATLHPNEGSGFANGEGGGLTIGMGGGGGGGRKKNKKNRKSEAAPVLQVAAAAEVPGLEGIETMEANADPNEPRYCVCNRVSFGVMIGCDNEDCPTEWYHLPCVGLLAEPTGKWLCPICRPHGVGVAAAAANLGAGSEHVKVPPSNGQKKSKKAVPKGAARRKR